MNLDPIPLPPKVLRDLLTGENDAAMLSSRFLNRIRSFNTAFSFTSTGCNVIRPANGKGPYSFKIHGKLYHQLGTFDPMHGQPARYAQLYIHDTDHDLTATTRAQGIGNSDNIGDAQKDEEIIRRLQDMMAHYNPFYPLNLHIIPLSLLHHAPLRTMPSYPYTPFHMSVSGEETRVCCKKKKEKKEKKNKTENMSLFAVTVH